MLPLSMPSEMSTLALLKRLLTTRKRHIRDIYANMARMVYHRTSQAKKGPDALQFSGEIPFKQERVCLTDFEAFEEHKQCSVHCVAVSLAINAIAVIWKLLPRKTNILRKIFLSSALDLLTLAVVAGYFFFSSTAWFMILDVKSRHIRSSPYVPFFHSLCDDCFAEFSSGLLFKSQFHLFYGDLYYKERKTWREQLYFVSLHVYNHVCWLAAVSSEKKKTLDANKLQLFSLLTIARCLKFTDRVSSLLRAKRATFTFWVDKRWLKMPKKG